MKIAFFCLCNFLALVPPMAIRAADDPQLAPLQAADSERVAAMIAADRDRLANIFSDELRYAHASGAVDNKGSLIDAITSGRTKYVAYEYAERNFTFPAPSIALMTGRAHIQAQTATGTMDSLMSFLGVWREENGHWHFIAWQSCKLSPAAPAAAK
jgi:hypothetical protein